MRGLYIIHTYLLYLKKLKNQAYKRLIANNYNKHKLVLTM